MDDGSPQLTKAVQGAGAAKLAVMLRKATDEKEAAEKKII